MIYRQNKQICRISIQNNNTHTKFTSLDTAVHIFQKKKEKKNCSDPTFKFEGEMEW